MHPSRPAGVRFYCESLTLAVVQVAEAGPFPGGLLGGSDAKYSDPVKVPRNKLDQRFAVLLVRSVYEAVDTLDFIPMVHWPFPPNLLSLPVTARTDSPPDGVSAERVPGQILEAASKRVRALPEAVLAHPSTAGRQNSLSHCMSYSGGCLSAGY